MEKVTFTGVGGVKLIGDSGGKGKPVLLLHGGGQTRGSWGRTAETLASRGYHAISMDARGHGESEWTPNNYGLEVQAGDVKAIIEAVGGKPALIGASMGGMTSLLATGESSTQIASALVLVDIATRVNPEGSKNIGNFMRGDMDGFASVEEAADAVSRYLPHRPRPKDISGLRRNLREGPNGRLYWHWDPTFVTGRHPDPTVMMERIEAAARRITIPTLLVRGGISDIVTKTEVDRFLEIVPKAEVAVVPGAGHMVAGDANSIFDVSVLEFLARVYPP